MLRPSSFGTMEGGKQVRQRHVRQSRRAEPHSLPHVLWRPAYKVAAAGAASFDLPPRTAASVVPACRAEDGTASRHATCSVAVRAPLSPKPVCATSCLGARSSHAARAAQPGLPLQTRRGRANLRGLRLSRPLLFVAPILPPFSPCTQTRNVTCSLSKDSLCHREATCT